MLLGRQKHLVFKDCTIDCATDTQKARRNDFAGFCVNWMSFCKHSLPGQIRAQTGKPCGDIGTALHQLAVTVLSNHGKSVFIIV